MELKPSILDWLVFIIFFKFCFIAISLYGFDTQTVDSRFVSICYYFKNSCNFSYCNSIYLGLKLKPSIFELYVFYCDFIGKMNLFTARVVLTSICLRSLFYYCNTKRIKTIIITLVKLQFYFNSTTRRSRTLFELKDSCSYSV